MIDSVRDFFLYVHFDEALEVLMTAVFGIVAWLVKIGLRPPFFIIKDKERQREMHPSWDL